MSDPITSPTAAVVPIATRRLPLDRDASVSVWVPVRPKAALVSHTSDDDAHGRAGRDKPRSVEAGAERRHVGGLAPDRDHPGKRRVS
jgi:hypothetical protein